MDLISKLLKLLNKRKKLRGKKRVRQLTLQIKRK